MSRRKMLAADEVIANRIADLAKRREATVFQTVNDILEQSLRADGMGLVLREIIDRRGTLEKARSAGLTFTMENLMYDVVDMAYEHAPTEISQLWLETGRWYGKYYSNKEDGIDAFKEAMDLLTFGISEFSLETSRNGGVFFSCVGERFTTGFTEVFSLFVEGVFDALGYKRASKETSKGIIRLNFERTR